MHKPSLNKKLYYETKSTIKENQQWSTLLYLFLVALSVFNNLPNEVKLCTNSNTFKRKVKGYFLYKIRQKDNDVCLSTRLLSSQQLMHFFFNYSFFCFLFFFLFCFFYFLFFIFFYFIFLTFYPILVYQFFKDHNENKAT